MITEQNLPFEILRDKMPITERQAETLSLCLQGYTYPEIAAIQDVSKRTVEVSFIRIRKNAGAINNHELIANAFCDGWIVPRR